MIKRIAFVAYPTDDVARTRAWYEDKLGLAFAGAYEEDGVEKYNETHLGDGCFSLIWSGWAARVPGSAASVAFEVDDLDATTQSLLKAGVTVVDVFDGPVCRQASIEDPAGNSIILHQQKPERLANVDTPAVTRNASSSKSAPGV
jgi:catechol 2,3-dioxygenase-like lactoylglutathione lyase family enzyme